MKQGGFPELLTITDAKTYVSDLVDNILKRDIEKRYKITYKEAFEQMAHHLLNVSPTAVVTTDLAELFHFKSEHTAKNYVSYLKQAFLLSGVKKFSRKSKVRTTQEKVYLIETKGNDKVFDKNVRQKQTAAVEWTRKINELKPEERMNREWEYVLISEDNFYGLSANGATITDICDRCKVSLSAATGELFV